MVPSGVVTFFSSYDFLEKFYNFFKENDFFRRIETKKRVFVEKRHGIQTDALLDQYSKAIKLCRNNPKGDFTHF